MPESAIDAAELYDVWPVLSQDERVEGFELLKREAADAFFLQLSARDRAQLVLSLPPGERRLWMRLLAPDDAVDVIQETPVEKREALLALFDEI
ncbi:MAG TPA: magnesium transporter, partial [Candidatus Binatia bacterium]